MLKLNTVDGKFDIVFAGDQLLGRGKLVTSPAGSGRHAKTKPHVLTKEPPNRVPRKGNRNIQNNKNNEDLRIKKVLPPDKKPLKKVPPKPPDKNNEKRTKGNNVGRAPNKKENTKKELPDIVAKETKEVELSVKAGTTDVSDNGGNSKDGDNGMYKRLAANAQLVRDAGNHRNAGVISREDLNNMFREFFQDGGASNVVEQVIAQGTAPSYTTTSTPRTFTKDPSPPHQPNNVRRHDDRSNPLTVSEEEYNPWGRPGCGAPPIKEKERIVSDYTSHGSPPHQHNVRRHDSRSNPLAVSEEEYNPWGRPGCGAPPLKEKERIVSDYTSHSSPPRLSTKREQNIQNYQNTFVEEYNPWGRPGCGAPLKDRDDNIIADLKSYNSSFSRSQSVPGQQVHQTERTGNLAQSPEDTTTTSPEQPNLGLSYNSTFARGKGRSVYELQDIQKRRNKELEHQAAIRQQVEEKRRLKQLEREREQMEEAKAEERFRREQERILEMSEMEKKKQREQEEKMQKQQEALQESIRKANLEAKKAKERKQESTKQTNPGHARHNPPEDHHQSVTRRLHHDEDVIMPTADKYETNDENILNDSLNISHKNRSKKENLYNNNNNNNQKLNVAPDVANDTFSQSAGYAQSVSSQSKENNVRNSIKANRDRPVGHGGNENKGVQQKPLTKPSTYTKSNHPGKNVASRTGARKKPGKPVSEIGETRSSNDYNRRSSSDGNGDSVVPFHRTETTDLIDNSSKPTMTSEVKKNSKEQLKDGTKRFEDAETRSADVTSVRQQQILDQLHALRQGLMRKEREYVLDKYV